MKNILRPFAFLLGVLIFHFTVKLCITPDFLIPFPEGELMLALYGWGVGVGIVHGVLVGSACLMFALVND
jgi:hypothetical protein